MTSARCARCACLALVCAGAALQPRGEAEVTIEQPGNRVVAEWSFDRWDDSEGWTVAPELGGVVTGGALWLTIDRGDRADPVPAFPFEIKGIALWSKYLWPLSDPPAIASPSGLGIPAAEASKVRIRLLNRSPETDGYLYWRTAESPEVDAGVVRFTMQPHCEDWQDIVVHIDRAWSGTIDALRIQPGTYYFSGDMFIDRVAVTDGPPRPAVARPDVCSEAVVPRLSLPGVTQADFADAFAVLDECLVTDVPAFGFTEPFMSPGGAYHPGWWQLDTSLNLEGAKWANQAFAEGVMRGFFATQAQNPDGRIDLYSGSAGHGMPLGFSSIPRYLEVGWNIARRTQDVALREAIYASLVRYLAYWHSPVKRDAASGLITAIFEETFGEPLSEPQTVAAVDLNVAVALGFRDVAQLADALGRPDEAAEHRRRFDALADAINRHCWDPDAGVYYNYNVRTGKRRPYLLCTTFDPMRAGIATPEQVARLIEKLLDPALFNWGERPLTSVAKTHPHFVEATGRYDGRGWYGDIWTMRNVPVVLGLSDQGRHDLAAELNWQTIHTFNANYAEFITPTAGSGEGVARYGWSASQYVQCIVEVLFGVDYDALAGRLRVFPRVPDALHGEPLTLEGLLLPTDPPTRLDVRLAVAGPREAEVSVQASRPLDVAVEICFPAEGLTAFDGSDSPMDAHPAADIANATAVAHPSGGDAWTVRFR